MRVSCTLFLPPAPSLFHVPTTTESAGRTHHLVRRQHLAAWRQTYHRIFLWKKRGFIWHSDAPPSPSPPPPPTLLPPSPPRPQLLPVLVFFVGFFYRLNFLCLISAIVWWGEAPPPSPFFFFFLSNRYSHPPAIPRTCKSGQVNTATMPFSVCKKNGFAFRLQRAKSVLFISFFFFFSLSFFYFLFATRRSYTLCRKAQRHY